MNDIFHQRLNARYEELRTLYCGLYHNDMGAFEYFCRMLERSFHSRKASLHLLAEEVRLRL